MFYINYSFNKVKEKQENKNILSMFKNIKENTRRLCLLFIQKGTKNDNTKIKI